MASNNRLDYLYGKLNKEVEYLQYKGENTQTAAVTVDNETNTIQVDVQKVPNAVTFILGSQILATYDGSISQTINLKTFDENLFVLNSQYTQDISQINSDILNNTQNISSNTDQINNLSQSIDNVNEKLDTFVSKQDTDIVQNVDINVEGDQAFMTLSTVNLQDNTLTPSQQAPTQIIPDATSTQSGLMPSSTVQAITDLQATVSQLQGKTTRLLYTAKTTPDADKINTFVTGLGYSSPFEGIAVVVDETFHIWHYYEGGTGWRDDGVDTVSNFTDTTPGIIKGSTQPGQIYANKDGTGSVVGWDNLQQSYVPNSTTIAGKPLTGNISLSPLTITQGSTQTTYDGSSNINLNISADGIQELVGTEDNPINFATDMEDDKLYQISGYFVMDMSSQRLIQCVYDSKFLVYKTAGISHTNYRYITILSAIINFTTNTLSPSIGNCSAWVETTGTLTNVSNATTPKSINGYTGAYKFSIYAPTTSGTSGQILQSNGTNNAPTWIDAQSITPNPIFETAAIDTTNWSTLSNNTPYTFTAEINIAASLSSNSIVELVNDQPALFATYGFAIGSISGQTATIYSIGQPSESITLKLGVTG